MLLSLLLFMIFKKWLLFFFFPLLYKVYFIPQKHWKLYYIVLTLYVEELWNKIYSQCFMPLSHLSVFYLYFVVLVSVLFRKAKKTKNKKPPPIPAFLSQSHFLRAHYEGILAVRPEQEAVCEPPYFNREIFKSLCTFWCHFYMIVFFSPFKLRDIDWNWLYDWIQITYFVNVKLYQWFWSD